MLSDPSSPGTPGSDAAADAPAVSASPQLPGGQPRPLQRQESTGQVGKATTTALLIMLRSCCRIEAWIEIPTILTETAVPMNCISGTVKKDASCSWSLWHGC